MKKKIDDILEGFYKKQYDLIEVRNKILELLNSPTKYQIDFNGNVLTKVEITNNNIVVIDSIDGWGNKIENNDIKISKTKEQ